MKLFLRNNQQKQTGFTIVELLIVIVVIAILAAISIVAYNGIQNRANNTAVQNDLAQIHKKLEMAKIDSTDDTYPELTSDVATTLELKISRSSYQIGNNNLLYCRSSDGSEYAIVARSKPLNTFYYGSRSGAGVYTPAWTGAAATTCNSVVAGSFTGVWGLTGSSGWARNL